MLLLISAPPSAWAAGLSQNRPVIGFPDKLDADPQIAGRLLQAAGAIDGARFAAVWRHVAIFMGEFDGAPFSDCTPVFDDVGDYALRIHFRLVHRIDAAWCARSCGVRELARPLFRKTLFELSDDPDPRLVPNVLCGPEPETPGTQRQLTLF